MTPEEIASVCHAANRALTAIIGDVAVQPPWNEAPEEMRTSSAKGVKYALEHPEASAAEQHDAWARDKLASGWKYGPVKNEETKEHPALLAFNDLPDGTKKKDALFRAVVGALSDQPSTGELVAMVSDLRRALRGYVPDDAGILADAADLLKKFNR